MSININTAPSINTFAKVGDYTDTFDVTVDSATDGAAGYFILFSGDAGAGALQLFFNNDSTNTHYYNQYMRVSNATLSGARTNEGKIYPNASAKYHGFCYVHYNAGTQLISAEGVVHINEGTTNDVITFSLHFTVTSAKITRLYMSPYSGAKYTLYNIRS